MISSPTLINTAPGRALKLVLAAILSASTLSVLICSVSWLVAVLNVIAVTALLVLDCTPRGEVPSAASSTFKMPAESTTLAAIFCPPAAEQVSMATRAASMANSNDGPFAAGTGAGLAASAGTSLTLASEAASAAWALRLKNANHKTSRLKYLFIIIYFLKRLKTS